ncbi:MAG: EAL domain-containing protein [Candidatus Peregrinibacteria bacterium]
MELEKIINGKETECIAVALRYESKNGEDMQDNLQKILLCINEHIGNAVPGVCVHVEEGVILIIAEKGIEPSDIIMAIHEKISDIDADTEIVAKNLRVGVFRIPEDLCHIPLDACSQCMLDCHKAIETIIKKSFPYELFELHMDHTREKLESLIKILLVFPSDVKEAIENDMNGFAMHFQPKCDKDGRILGVEALLRFSIAGLQKSPEVVIKIKKLLQKEKELQNFVLERSISFAKEFGVKTAINSTQFDLEDPSYAISLLQKCKKFGLNPQMIEIEA